MTCVIFKSVLSSIIIFSQIGCEPVPIMAIPDMIVVNADIYTVDADTPRAEALAVKDGRFIAVGSTEEIQALGDDQTQIIDAQGATVVPGFIDAHSHISGTAPVVAGVDLSYIADKADWLQLIAEAEARLPEGVWLTGGYWDHTLSEGLYPTKEMLDSVAPNRPALLTHIDGHYAWANSQALQMAGITADRPVPAGGEILLDRETGEPTGILLEGAQFLVRDIIPEIDDDRRREGLAKMQAYANGFGITGLHQMGSLEDYRHQLKTGQPRLRVWYGAWLSGGPEGEIGNAIEDILKTQAQVNKEVNDTGKTQIYGPLLEIGFVKLMNDGVLSAHTAALTEEYSDRAGWKGEYVTSPAKLIEQVRAVNTAGLPVAIHSIGDAAVRASLDAFEAALEIERALPNRIEHVELLHTEDIKRFRTLGVVASMQPNHATNAIAYVPLRVGADREARAYMWRSLKEAGVPLVFSSDYPTSPLNPLVQMADAIFRVSPFGLNDGQPWHPKEALDFEAALEAYTLSGASITPWKDEIGSIRVGKWADFVVLSGRVPEPMTESFRKLQVNSTYLAGKDVYMRAD